MAKYNYDKSILKGLGTQDFLHQVQLRQEHIDAADAAVPVSVFNPNRLAAELHPGFVWGRVNKIIPLPAGKTYIIGPAKEKGFQKLPPFRPGQHITVELDMPDKFTRRNYCITSAPVAARGENGFYQLVVSDYGPGHASEYILNTWQEGTLIRFSAPTGEGYYDPLRDTRDVLAIGIGGPAMSLCADIMAGGTDINLTVMAIIPVPAALGITDAYKAMEAKTNGKIHAVPVLLNGEAPGCEKGPVTAELLRKCMTDPQTGVLKDMTVFITCPDPICSVIASELQKLGLPPKRIRKEAQGDQRPVFARPDYPDEKMPKQYKLTVWVRGESTVLDCSSDKTLADAVEAAKIRLKTSCRAGSCGLCHSRWIRGEYYMPASQDGRREADRKFGWIHPCCTYPRSDMEIEVYPDLV